MIDPQDYIDYFEDLATRHKKIRHNPEGEKRFTAISMEDVINNINHNLTFIASDGEADYALLLLENISGQFRGRDVRNMNDEADGAFVVLKHCPPEDFDRERAIYKECKLIAKSILGTMTKDYEENADSIMQYLEPASGVRYQKVGPVFENCFGIRVEFGFSSSTLFVHNDADYDEV